MPNPIMKSATAIGLCLLAAGCFKTTYKPEIVASISPQTPSEQTISADLLRTCFKDEPRALAQIKDRTTSDFSLMATYKISDIMRRSSRDMPKYADRIRAYPFKYEVNGLFGKKQNSSLCYYEKTPHGLRFIRRIDTRANWRVAPEEMTSAVQDMYGEMRGKPMTFMERLW